MTPSELLSRARAKKPPAPAVPAEADNDEGRPHDVAALEAELEAAQAAAENGDEWNGRDPSVIEDELHAAELAARVASDLNTGAEGNVTRKELEEFKVAVAVAFVGIEAALRDPSVSPRSVLDLVSANVAAIGFSRAQAKELADFEHRANVVGKHYHDWDRRTKSQREYAAREAAMRRPRWS